MMTPTFRGLRPPLIRSPAGDCPQTYRRRSLPMLDPNALSQLTQLKQTIRTEKNLSEGTVRGSQGRFGFVVLDDGREAFLPPDEMARVLPGDRVEISVKEKEDNQGSKKIDAELDKLISSQTKKLVGQYIVRGKGHFVAVDMPQLNRWIFIPPKARGKAKAGDYLLCRLTRHPFEDGKGQAKVLEVLGNPEDANIEHKVVTQKHDLPLRWNKEQCAQTDAIVSSELSQLSDYDKRAKLQDIPFITIDAETTRDMDDALYIESNDSGWRVSVAIADPTSSIAEHSALDRAALQRANTAYLPGKAITMLPDDLSHNTFSLVEAQDRPALVCQLQINSDGAIDSAEFEFAIVRSAHKLSYEKVAAFLQNDDKQAVAEDCQPLLSTLLECSSALNQYRSQHMLLMEDRDDYALELNERGHISDIKREERNLAQQIVEECMLATNRSAGDLFAQHPQSGIFSVHRGFREERMDSIEKVINEDFPELKDLDLRSADGYRELVQKLQQSEKNSTQLDAMRLMLQAGILTTEAAPHMGLGMDHYATITSPIRRYNDLYNHRALRAIIEQGSITPPTQESLDSLQKRVSSTRQSSRDLEQWLFCLFMEQHQNEEFEGRIFRVTSQGITVQIKAWGINGFVKLDPKAFKFDADRMTLVNDEQGFCLNQTVHVKLAKVDMDKKRINFTLVPQS